MTASRRIAALALCALACVFAWPAYAGLTLCDRTSYVLYAATGAERGSEAQTTGWLRLLPGSCRTAIEGPLARGAYFVYARSSLAHSGPMRAWAGARSLCVKDGPFALREPSGAPRCSSDEAFLLPFAALDTHRRRNWTMTFDEAPPYKSIKDAETAGLKRLLKDQGARIGAIDAGQDKASAAALAAFRKRFNIAPTATAANLFDALESRALKTTAPSGYAVCNDTTKAIWVALGLNVKGKWISRGWWKIAAGGCAKAIGDPLAADAIDILAQTPGGVPIVYGPQRFCVTNVEFEIEGRKDCKKRGLSEAGFAETKVKGLSGYTAHVSESGLVAHGPQSGAPK
ncbi:MAG TPA: DUF1036 domain-containing protein [Rhizomicrobium sp.]|nr:DUF1036 domain-containing protein [Rhizomicrobium sp.]